MRPLFLTLVLAGLAATAQAQDYFPLGDSDSWTYGVIYEPPFAPADTVRYAPVSVSERVTVRDTAYVVIDLPHLLSDTLRTDAEGRVWGRIVGHDRLLLDLTLCDGASYKVVDPVDAFVYTVTVHRPLRYHTAGGAFEGVVEFWFVVPDVFDEERSVALAPGVGVVAAYGPVWDHRELFHATVGGRQVTASEGGPLAATVRAFPNPFAAALTVELPAARWRSAEVVDVLGRRVAGLDVRACGTGCTLRWDAASAAPGLYVVRAEGTSGAVALAVVLDR